MLIFPAIILNRMLLLITWYLFHNYFWPRPWPQPPEIGLSLCLVPMASALRFWPRLTSLTITATTTNTNITTTAINQPVASVTVADGSVLHARM